MNASTVFHCKKKVALVIAFVSHRASDLVQSELVGAMDMDWKDREKSQDQDS